MELHIDCQWLDSTFQIIHVEMITASILLFPQSVFKRNNIVLFFEDNKAK